MKTQKRRGRSYAAVITGMIILAAFAYTSCYDDTGLPQQKNAYLVGIDIETDLVKRVYYVDESFSWAGLVVYALYSDGARKWVPLYDFACTGFSSAVRGEKVITVGYKNVFATFTVTVINPVAAPTAQPPAGPVDIGAEISLACATADAEIWYTTDGSRPAKNGAASSRYLAPLVFTESMTLRAIGVKEDMEDSRELEESYVPVVPLGGMGLAAADISLYFGETVKFTPLFSPAEATNKTVTWTSSDESVVRVHVFEAPSEAPPQTINDPLLPIIEYLTSYDKGDSMLVGAGKGTALVTATTEDGGFTAECTVTVSGYDSLMVPIPAGTFIMGSSREERNNIFGGPATVSERDETQHEVTLTRGFSMSKYTVTQAQFELVVGRLPEVFDPVVLNIFLKRPRVAIGGGLENHPIYQINWYNAILFCNMLSMREGLNPVYGINGSTDPADWGPPPPVWTETDLHKLILSYNDQEKAWVKVEWIDGADGYRLPTDAEWEYACRAGTTTAFNWGTDSISDTQANFFASETDFWNKVPGITRRGTTPVGSFAPNAWGLYDMHGNVHEYCWDVWSWRPFASKEDWIHTDPRGPDIHAFAKEKEEETGFTPYTFFIPRVGRGGDFMRTATYVRSAVRFNLSTASSGVQDHYGFRVARFM